VPGAAFARCHHHSRNTSAEYAIHSSFSETLKLAWGHTSRRAQNLHFAKGDQKETDAYNRNNKQAGLEDSGPFLARVFLLFLQGPKKTRTVCGSKQLRKSAAIRICTLPPPAATLQLNMPSIPHFLNP
jgi:hypothetical protein